ncbi:MAG: hypothetical protein ACKOES_11810, partial [Planctomycetaceae bacterium]
MSVSRPLRTATSESKAPSAATSARRCRGPVSRRSFLEIGSIGATGLGLADLLRFRSASAASAGTPAADTAVIFIWLPGGFPHLETYDMKPE